MSESINHRNKRKPPPEHTNNNRTISKKCIRCTKFDCPPGKVQCERCIASNTLLFQDITAASKLSEAARVSARVQEARAAALSTAGYTSYNHWVNTASNSAFRNSNSTADYHRLSTQFPYEHIHARMGSSSSSSSFGGMPREQFEQELLAVQHHAAAAAAHAHHRAGEYSRGTTTTTHPPPPLSSLNYLNMATAAATPHHHFPLPTTTTTTTTENALTARYLLRGMNGGHEPNPAQIVEFMEMMNSGATTTTTTTGASSGGSGLLRARGGSSSSYINHTTIAAPPTTLRNGVREAQQQLASVMRHQQQYPHPIQQPTIIHQPQPPPHATVMSQRHTQPRLKIRNSIIPCPTGVQEIDSKSVLENITNRVRDECELLCLLPSRDYSRERTRVGGGYDGRKSPNEWLRCAVSLVYSSLNVASPNPLGWEKQQQQQQRQQQQERGASSPKDAYWFKGIYHMLCGPQPWQCTRPFITKHVLELLLAEGYADWLISEHRWSALEPMMRHTIACNLVVWKPKLFAGNGDAVEECSKKIWREYRLGYLQKIKEYEKALVPPQIGFTYVCDLVSRSGWLASHSEEVGPDPVEETSSSDDVVDEANDDGGVGSEEEEVARWTCDYCPAIFEDYDEAVAHEKGCKEKSQEDEANDGAGETNRASEMRHSEGDDDVLGSDGNYVVEKKWKCDYCATSFSIYEVAVAHEDECKAKSMSTENAENEDEANDDSGASDVNAEKSSAVDDSVHDEALSADNKRNAGPQEEEKKGEDVIVSTEANVVVNQSSVEMKEEAELARVASNQSNTEGNGEVVMEDGWKCDYCFAYFASYDDAVSHENECNAKAASTATAGGDATVSEENKTRVENGQKNVDYVLEEKFKCDNCEAHFSDFDEAAAHEAECKQVSEAATSLPAEGNTAVPPELAQDIGTQNGTDFTVSEEVRLNVLETLETLRFEYFPLMDGGDEKMGEVCEKVLTCMHAITPITTSDGVSKKSVILVLNELEHRSGYLSSLNDIFRLRVDTKALLDHSESPSESPRSMSPEYEVDREDNVVTHDFTSYEDQEFIMATTSPEGRQGATKSRTSQSPCGDCILCSAPDCERCFVCLSKGQAETEVCIRKSCCKIAFELKAKPATGFPHGWQYAFCDPNPEFLVKSPRRILSLAGLVIRRPLLSVSSSDQAQTYQHFHSFESAFSAVQHEDTSKATVLVESFLSSIHGSDAVRSFPNHVLVGRRVCFEFTNADGMNVSMFGVISTCFREGSEAEKDIFMVQYDSTCIEIAAKSLATDVVRLQLLSSEQAWGGCISFERKSYIRGDRSIVGTVDQATAIEYWVVPSMRMEELVEQRNGIKTPQLTIFLRGYKFVFSAHNGYNGTSVTVSCISMNVEDRNDEKSILKPGELIDLGVFCPLADNMDTKPLAVFIMKNYVHNFTINAHVEDGNGRVYDLTDDARGLMHNEALKKVLSYVRSGTDADIPTIHFGVDPSGKVHLLFGVQYRGDWKEYTDAMEKEIHPTFRGQTKEVTLSRNAVKDEDREARYFSAMINFGPDEIVECSKFFESQFLGESVRVPPPAMKERIRRIGTGLRRCIAELGLGDIQMNDADQLIRRSIDRLNLAGSRNKV